MPIPSKKPGQSENEFIQECVSAIVDEYGVVQALGICYSKSRENMSTQEKIMSRMNQAKIDLEDPCWEGYRQYGMKEKDGVLIQNCVKID